MFDQETLYVLSVLFVDPMHFLYGKLGLLRKKENYETDGYSAWNAITSTKDCNPDIICPQQLTWDDFKYFQRREFDMLNKIYMIYAFAFVCGAIFLAILAAIYHSVYK